MRNKTIFNAMENKKLFRKSHRNLPYGSAIINFHQHNNVNSEEWIDGQIGDKISIIKC